MSIIISTLSTKKNTEIMNTFGHKNSEYGEITFLKAL